MPPELPDPVVRPRPPRFAQVGRPAPGEGERWSRPLMLVIAVGVFLAFVSLVYGLQVRERLTVVEVTFMEEEAEEAWRQVERGGREGGGSEGE